MALRAVLFDLWETLINDTPERAQPRRIWRSTTVRDVLRRHEFEADLDEVQAALDATTTALTELHDDGIDLGSEGRAQLFIERLTGQTGRAAPRAAADDLEAVVTAMPLDMAPIAAPYAVETVSALKTMGLATALVCNAGFTTAPHLRLMLKHYGLLQHLDVLVFSDELRVAKPDARIFTAALEGLRLPASECAFVGDNPHTDIFGAQSAGLFAVQVGGKSRDGIVPDARIERLQQLLALLEEEPRLSV